MSSRSTTNETEATEATDATDTVSVPPIESIDRALLLLEELSCAPAAGFALAELAGRITSNKATVYRALRTMMRRGFVAQDATTGNYRIGSTALLLGRNHISGTSLAESAHPALVALSRSLGELVHLAELIGDQMLYLDKVEPDRPIRVWSSIGRAAPVANTALGRAVLAFNGVERRQVKAYLKNPDVGAITEERLWKVVEETRRRGYSLEIEENEPGIACLGVPLLQGDRTVGALSVTTFADTFTPERRQEIVTQIARTVPPLLSGGLSLPEALLASVATARD